MTFTEKFQSLKVAFDKANTKNFDADFAVQLTMTDEDCGGTFYIEYKNGNYSVEPYDYYDNTATVLAPADAIAKLSKGVVAKDLIIGGNEENIKALAASLKPAKKPAAKKTTAKKAEPKKAEEKKEAPKAAEKTVAKTTAKKEEKKAPAKKACAKKTPAKKAETKATTPAASKATVKKDTKAAK